MGCNLNIDYNKAKALTGVRDYFGTNQSALYDHIIIAVNQNSSTGDIEFNSDFKNWWKNVAKLKSELDIATTDPKLLKDKLLAYYAYTIPTIEGGIRENTGFDKVGAFNYSGISARNYAKRVFATEMYKEYKRLLSTPDTKVKSFRASCGSKALTVFRSILAKRLWLYLNPDKPFTKGASSEIFSHLVDNESAAYIRNLVGDDAPTQLNDLIALYTELTSTEVTNFRNEFIDEVLLDPRLVDIRDLQNISEDDEVINDAVTELAADDPESDTENQTDDSDMDISIRVYGEHSGIYKDYMMHVSSSLKALLSTISKLNDFNSNNDVLDYNLDNPLGIPDVHDARELANIIYRNIDFDNADDMIEQLENAAKTLPGYAGLSILAKELKNNLDLKFEFYRTFRKAIMGKLETVVKDGKVSNRIVNTTSSRLDALRYTLATNLKSSAIRLDLDFAKQELLLARNVFGNKKNIGIVDNETNDFITKYLYPQLKNFFPYIQEANIQRFIYNNKINGNIDVRANITNLLNILDNTIKKSSDIYDRYRELDNERKKAYYKNKKLVADNAGNPDSVKDSDFEDLEALYAKSYMNPVDAAPAYELASMLAPYTVVSGSLNTANSLGNQSSDVINDSMITWLKGIFESALNNPDANGIISENSPLANFARHKFQSQQYDFGNLLLEKKDDKGNIINYGLFYKDKEGKIHITSYASQLLRFSLFNGASNIDTADGIVYSTMSRPDYIATAWINFFDEDIIDENGKKIKAAEYFLRIPSDAPKTFTLRAPRYSIAGFRTLTNSSVINKAITDKINKLVKIYDGETKDIIFASDPIFNINKPFTKKDLLKFTSFDGTGTFIIPTKNRNNSKLEKGKEVKIALQYLVPSEEEKDNAVAFVISGIYEDGKITNAKFEGFSNKDYNKHTVSIISDLREAIRSEVERTGEINGVKEEYKLNKKHLLYQQLRNAFIQELQDAVTALDVIFKTEEVTLPDGRVGYRVSRRKGTNSLIFRQGNNKNHGWLSKHYHYNNDTGEIVSGERGHEKLQGKVFTSDRFVLYDGEENNGKGAKINYGQRILDEAIDFLYGGAESIDKLLLYTKDADGKVHPVLTESMEEAIERNLNDFVSKLVEVDRRKLNASRNFIKGKEITTDNILDFAINHHLMYINFNDILEGDTKFYKSSTDFLKRAKEYQGSGVAYGIATRNGAIDNLLQTSEIPSELDKHPEIRVRLKTTFVGVTIKNTIRHDNETIARLEKQLVEQAHLTPDAAATLMRGAEKKGKRTGGYQDIITNDAQSYITFDEWIRRITARGQFYKYKSLIDKILDPNSVISAFDLTEFVQVQKNFYYDQHYNAKTRTIGPRQIKNAEFVLVPRFIQGTELEKVYDLMKKHGIDQLNTAETSKAAQGYILEIFDEKTGAIKQDILDELDDKTDADGNLITSEFSKNVKDAIENFDYSHLYTQQETPQHMNARNKAGLQIMKKIVDNINPDSPLYKHKTEFFELYAENIKESFNTLMSELNIELDENGNIKINDDGTVEGLDYKMLYDKLTAELARLGLDSNLKDYVTLDPESPGNTMMPNYMSLVAQKLENVAQALFNNNITRQTLPGFHAAQITNIGFKSLRNIVGQGKVGYSDKLRYHPDGKNYIEVMVPASAFGFDRHSAAANAIREKALQEGKTKEEAEEAVNNMFLTQLQQEGLDLFIGYRIPTEGKQSICNMKVVGFIDDAYGSTIVVPDEWVAQTGSDFDIDSVYTIMYNTFINKKGNIQKVEYSEDNDKLYIDYVRRNIGNERMNKLFDNSRLEEDEKVEIINANTSNEGVVDWAAVTKELKETSAQMLREDIASTAKREGLMSYDEYSKLSIVSRNNRSARENRMISDMIKILTSNESLEENLSRSNFDDVMDAFDKVLQYNNKFKEERDARSPYNFFDQADYQEDAMSGALLKGFSVARDTLCSVCNTAKTRIKDVAALHIVYNYSNLSKEAYKAKVKQLKESFEKVDTDDNAQKVIITHNTFGNTKNNKNVEGKILTAYSSQTTAHILDAIKKGSIPNVNRLTFGVYKTFVDVGSNYDTAVSFITQPGITRLVNIYNATNSIFSDEYGFDYVGQAIKDIAKELGISVTSDMNNDDVLAEINHKFGTKFSLNEKDGSNLAFDSSIQLARLAGEEELYKVSINSPVEKLSMHENALLYDLATIIKYNNLNKLVTDISNAARVSNPDRFGAKQTLYATNEIFDKIQEISADDNFRLTVNEKNFVDALYPGAKEGVDAFAKQTLPATESVYPPLYAFLKYATATSIVVNRTLFKTQTEEFNAYIKSIENLFSDGKRMNEPIYKQIREYIIGSLYRRTRFINQPLRYNLGVGRNRGFTYMSKDANTPNFAEFERVYGYNSNPDLSIVILDKVYSYDEQGKETVKVVPVSEKLVIENLNNPTQEELDAFAKFSPAQKVMFIQKHFADRGIFDYISADLANNRTTKYTKPGAQTITFNEDAIDIETAYSMFYQAFTNRNPFVALAAADLVKYAFVVEGYTMGMHNISKLISNKVLYSNSKIYGTSIVQDMNEAMADVSNYLDVSLKENFIRSHSNISTINRRTVKKIPRKGYELARRANGLIVIENTAAGRALAENYGITYTENNRTMQNSYVVLKFGNVRTLYRITSESIGYVLVPLNLLENNENDEFSVKSENTKYPSPAYYAKIISDYNDETTRMGISVYSASILTEVANKINKEDYEGTYDKKSKKKVQGKQFKLDREDQLSKKIIDVVNKWNSTRIEDGKPATYFISNAMSDYIPTFNDIVITSVPIYHTDANGKQVLDYKLNVIITKKNVKVAMRTYIKDKGALDRTPRDSEKDLVSLLRNFTKGKEETFRTNLDNVYEVTVTSAPVDPGDELHFSTINDVLTQGVNSVAANVYRYNEKEARDFYQRWSDEGYLEDTASVKNNANDIIPDIAKYVTDKAKKINESLNHFIAESEESSIRMPITDPRVMDKVKENPAVRTLYLKTLMEPYLLMRQFSAIKELSIESEDERINSYLKKIKDTISSIENSEIVAKAKENYIKDYIDAQSDNPYIRKGLMSVVSGFYRTNWFNATFNDIQETSNPLIQVTMKNVMKDLRAQEMEARRAIDKFTKEIDRLKAEAKAKGLSFDFKNIIDEYGRFINNYTDKFIEDRDRLQKAANEAKAKANDVARTKGLGSNEHVKAYLDYLKKRLEYNEWKAKNLHQPVVQSYYDEMNKLERDMIYGKEEFDPETGRRYRAGGSPYIYTLHEIYRAERARVRNEYIDDTSDETLDAELTELDNAIYSLSQTLVVDDITDAVKEKVRYERDPRDEDDAINMARDSYTAAIRLKNFLDERNGIEHKYFKYDPKFNFEEDLKHYLDIIDRAENRDANDIPQTSQQELLKNEEYQKAILWIKRNAYRQPLLKDDDSWFDELEKAYESLNDETNDFGIKFAKIVRDKRYRDAYGQINPMLISIEDMKKLKEAQESNYKIKKERPYSDRNLLSNKKDNIDVVFTRAFYSGLTGAGSNRTDNPEWQALITEINNILAPYYSEANKTILFAKILNEPNAEEILTQLSDAYDKLHAFAEEKDRFGKKVKKPGVRKFIEDNVNFATNEEAFEADALLAESRKSTLRRLLNNIIYEVGIDGNRQPNRFLYQTVTLKLKDSSALEKYIEGDTSSIDAEDLAKLRAYVDLDKTRAIRTIKKYTYTTPSRYYYIAEAAARSGEDLQGYANYNEWYTANHIYNPNTNSFEPLRVWMVRNYKAGLSYYWSPKFPQTVRTVRDGKKDTTFYGPVTEEELNAANEYDESIDFRNTEYKEGGHSLNFKGDSSSEYYKSNSANEYELAAKALMQNVMSQLIHNSDARRFFEKGFLPSRARKGEKSVSDFAKQETLKLFGLNATNTGREDWYRDIDYYRDRPSAMPMMQILKNKYIEDKKEALGERPVKGTMTDEEYFRAKEAWDAKYREYQKEALETHKELLEHDPVAAISEFILKASQYNAIQNNKYELFFAQQALRDYGTYTEKFGLGSKLAKGARYSSDPYVKSTDILLAEQFDNVIRRLVYDQWKEPQGKLTKWMSALQSFTSAKYMMFNVKGGIANITLGDSQILGEALASNQFGLKYWGKGKSTYLSGLYDYIANAYSDSSVSLQGAVIKHFDVIDYDEHTGLGHLNTDLAAISERARDLAYTPQTAGEHYMQNSVLFSMLFSHRVIKNKDAGKPGEPLYKIINFAEYIRDIREEVLKSIVDEETWNRYQSIINNISSDANTMKEYAWFRRDMTEEFLHTLSKDIQRKFRDEIKDRKKKAETDFNKLSDVYSQFELKDGKLHIKAGTELAEMDVAKPDGTATDAMQLLGAFKGRVISVNKKIHGVYDKSGRAQIEKNWIGGLIMQYHKHLPVGLMNRYRIRGMFNEERGTVEKGMYSSLLHFLSIPFRNHQEALGLSDKEVEVGIGIQNILKDTLDFCTNATLYWDLMPEYDKANIRRMGGDILGTLAAICLVIALKAMEDDEDEVWWNLMMYEADRLATEASQYNPVFLPVEGKKLWSSPIAGFNGINDIFMTTQFIAQYLFDPDFSMTYTTGKNAGRNRLAVRLESNIPIWRGIKSTFVDITENNKYYKVGKNTLGFTGLN